MIIFFIFIYLTLALILYGIIRGANKNKTKKEIEDEDIEQMKYLKKLENGGKNGRK